MWNPARKHSHIAVMASGVVFASRYACKAKRVVVDGLIGQPHQDQLEKRLRVSGDKGLRHRIILCQEREVEVVLGDLSVGTCVKVECRDDVHHDPFG